MAAINSARLKTDGRAQEALLPHLINALNFVETVETITRLDATTAIRLMEMAAVRLVRSNHSGIASEATTLVPMFASSSESALCR